jgi:hypothetical protein
LQRNSMTNMPTKRGGRSKCRIRRIDPTEHQIQAAFIAECRLLETSYPELRLGFAIPNAARRSFALAARMKAEGLRAGVLDWHLPVSRGAYRGLWIEFKRPGEDLTPLQSAYKHLLESEGHLVYVHTSAERAVQSVKGYLA